MRHREQSSKPHAFTLIELLVAMAVTALLLAMLASVVSFIIVTYQNSSGNIIARRDADFALDTLVTDLESLAVAQHLTASGNPVESLRAEPDSVNGIASTWLVFNAVLLDADPESLSRSPRAVSYRIAYQDAIDGEAGPAPASFALYRALQPASVTFEEALEVDNLLAGFWADATPPANAPANFLVGNVVNFKVRFLLSDGTTWEPDQPNSQSVSINAEGAWIGTGPGAATRLDGGIAAIEASVTVLTPQGATLLQSGQPLDGLIERFSVTHTRRTSILGSGL